MFSIDRRTFLSGLAGSLFVASTEAVRAAPQYLEGAKKHPAAGSEGGACWLDVAAPFVLVDPSQQLATELLLTATCFPGVDGYRDSHYATEYQILLFDAEGKEIRLDRGGRLEIPALRPTLLDMREMSGRDSFFGGAKIRLAPSANQVPRAGDLFSAGFVRWNLPDNFDNVHAHPAPPQQVIGHFNYSMPFPALSEYHCAFALFNPNEDESFGTVRVVDRLGRTVVQRAYHLDAHHSILYTLADLKPVGTPGEALAITPLSQPKLADGGVVVVHNDSERVPFAYTFMKGRQGNSFTVEHPLHFGADAPMKPARVTPYGPNRSFPASALLYTPLLFRGLRAGGVELESRFYVSSSRWVEEALWLMPFVTTGDGQIAWVSNRDDQFAQRVAPADVTSQGLLRLTEFQSARIDARGLPLPDAYSGGFGVATIPKTSHSLLKVEVQAKNWGRVAFTHFRPGGATAKSYREVTDRGNLASDYIVSGAHVIGGTSNRKRDCLLAIMNIEFEDEHTGAPKLQLFGPAGLVAEKQLGDFPPLACRHLLVSELFPGVQSDPAHPFTVRMQVANAMMVVSAVHLDYERRDLALEHGSDRHSTFQDFKC
ncbi:MAG TPA: hypothetical protein VLY04_05075 [Bryobacteraceae bacterium]|nr:hypothetical protein [Bryobacteraceae bacterium]